MSYHDSNLLGFCNLVTPKSQNRITIYPCLFSLMHLIPMPIRMPIAHAHAHQIFSDLTHLWQLTRSIKDLCNLYYFTSFSAPSYKITLSMHNLHIFKSSSLHLLGPVLLSAALQISTFDKQWVWYWTQSNLPHIKTCASSNPIGYM